MLTKTVEFHAEQEKVTTMLQVLFTKLSLTYMSNFKISSIDRNEWKGISFIFATMKKKSH